MSWSGQVVTPAGYVPWAEVSTRLKEKRKREKISLRKASEELGISYSQLSRYELGLGKMTRSPEKWRRLSEWLGMDPAATAVTVVIGPEGAMPHIYKIIDDDETLDLGAKEALCYIMTSAYDAYAEVMDGGQVAGGGVFKQEAVL